MYWVWKDTHWFCNKPSFWYDTSVFKGAYRLHYMHSHQRTNRVTVFWHVTLRYTQNEGERMEDILLAWPYKDTKHERMKRMCVCVCLCWFWCKLGQPHLTVTVGTECMPNFEKMLCDIYFLSLPNFLFSYKLSKEGQMHSIMSLFSIIHFIHNVIKEWKYEVYV